MLFVNISIASLLVAFQHFFYFVFHLRGELGGLEHLPPTALRQKEHLYSVARDFCLDDRFAARVKLDKLRGGQTVEHSLDRWAAELKAYRAGLSREHKSVLAAIHAFAEPLGYAVYKPFAVDNNVCYPIETIVAPCRFLIVFVIGENIEVNRLSIRLRQ